MRRLPVLLVLALVSAGCRATSDYAVRMRPEVYDGECVQRCAGEHLFRRDTESYLACLSGCPDVEVAKGECADLPPAPETRCANQSFSHFDGGRTGGLILLLAFGLVALMVVPPPGK